MCQRLWEWSASVRSGLCVCVCVYPGASVSRHNQHCMSNCPDPEQPFLAVLIGSVPAYAQLSFCTTEESDWKQKRTLKINGETKRRSGQDVDHHANSHVRDGQSRRIGKMIIMINRIELWVDVLLSLIRGSPQPFMSLRSAKLISCLLQSFCNILCILESCVSSVEAFRLNILRCCCNFLHYVISHQAD